MSGLPTIDEVRRAQAIIQDSIDSHVTWRDYRAKQGKDNPEYGDIHHHVQCLKEYAEVMAVLDKVAAATQAEGSK